MPTGCSGCVMVQQSCSRHQPIAPPSDCRMRSTAPSQTNWRTRLNVSIESEIFLRSPRGRDAVSVGESPVNVHVEVLGHKSEKAPGTPLSASAGKLILKEGEFVSYRIRNNSTFKVDVTLLIVGSDYEIRQYFPEPGEVAKASLDKGGKFDTPPPHGRVGGSPSAKNR